MGRKAHKGEITAGGALVVRIGRFSADKLNGAAEDVGMSGHAYGISVQCSPNVTNMKNINELVETVRDTFKGKIESVGYTTVKKIIQKGGWVQKSPLPKNPDHAVIVCAKPKALSSLFSNMKV